MRLNLLRLKIKLKSLAEEARIIRSEELKITGATECVEVTALDDTHRRITRKVKIGGQYRDALYLMEHGGIVTKEMLESINNSREALYLHRVIDVRNMARATHLVYAFLRGRKYRQVETPKKNPHYSDKDRSILKPRGGAENEMLLSIYHMLKKYGGLKDQEVKSAFEAWVTANEEQLEKVA